MDWSEFYWRVPEEEHVAPGPQVQAVAGGLLILPPPEPPAVPGARARRWCYGIAAVASAGCLVMALVSDSFPWPLLATALVGLITALAFGHRRERAEVAAQPDPEPTPKRHAEQCDTPGCDCRPTVPSYCAGCDLVVEDDRAMVWTVDGLWRCPGCAGVDIAPDPGLAGLLAAVAGTGAATLPIIAGPDLPDLHEQFADDMEVYRQVRVDGAVVREVRDWGS